MESTSIRSARKSTLASDTYARLAFYANITWLLVAFLLHIRAHSLEGKVRHLEEALVATQRQSEALRTKLETLKTELEVTPPTTVVKFYITSPEMAKQVLGRLPSFGNTMPKIKEVRN